MKRQAVKKVDQRISKVCSRPGCENRFKAFQKSYKEKAYCSEYCKNKHWANQFRPNRGTL
jgi:hypothetical protein